MHKADLTEIAKMRLVSQGISTASPKSAGRRRSAAEVAAWMGAVQAQDYAMAKWAIGLRLPGSTDTDIDSALDKGEIIRTHILRPTWHLVAATDIRWMLALSAPHVKARSASQNRALGLDASVFKRSNDIIRRSLEGGKQLTRTELMFRLEEQGINTSGNRGAHLMFSAELDGLVCNGARRGKQFTYALLDERVPEGLALPREEALALLADRYFASHGPATMQDFTWWSGLPVKDVRYAINAIRPALASDKHGELTFYHSVTGCATPARSRQVHLLPAFDEYLISYQDRSPSLPPSLFREVFTLNGIFKPVLVQNGKVIGTWRRTISREKVVIELTSFGNFSKTTLQGVASAAARYGRFLGLEAEVLTP